VNPLPRQPEVNIGMIGHVDHGKCLHPSERVLTSLGLLGMEELLEEPGRELGPVWDGLLFDPGIMVRGVGPGGPSWRRALLYVEEFSGPMVSLRIGGRTHVTTPQHRFWGPGGWVRALDLAVGDRVLAEGGWLPVEGKEILDYDGPIVDLTVPETANFLLGEEGILVHNTTLTKAITGVWTDKHSEEIMRGITIKLGYADAAIYRCPDLPDPEAYTTDPSACPGAELKRVISIVDAPGHETLMGTMLSGAAIMDGAILVIAANEPCPRPQTREHLTAVQIIGVTDIVVAQNKVDVVDDRRAYENYEEIRRFLEETPYADAPIIPISAQHNANIDVLLRAIVEHIRVPERDLASPPLMYIVRSFDVNKPGTRPRDLVGGVVGGSILRGKLRVGDEDRDQARPGARARQALGAHKDRDNLPGLRRGHEGGGGSWGSRRHRDQARSLIHEGRRPDRQGTGPPRGDAGHPAPARGRVPPPGQGRRPGGGCQGGSPESRGDRDPQRRLGDDDRYDN